MSFRWRLVLQSIQMLMTLRPKRWRSLPPLANSPALNLKGIAYGISVLLAQGRWGNIHVNSSSLQRDYASSMPIWQRNLSSGKEDTATSRLQMWLPMPGKYPAEVFSLANAPTRMGNFPVQHPFYAQYHLMNVSWPPLQLTSPKHWYLHHINLPIVNDLSTGSTNDNVKSFWNKETTTELEKARLIILHGSVSQCAKQQGWIMTSLQVKPSE